MSFWISKKVKKTRKKHRCEYCGAIIEIGSSCFNEVGNYYGDFNNYYLCDRCYMIRPYINNEEELGEFISDIIDIGILSCPSCNSWNLREYDFSKDMLSVECECDNCDEKWTVNLSADNIKEMIKGRK